MKLSTAIAGIFIIVASAGMAAAQETEPAMPGEACSAWLEQGNEEESCKASLAFWADKLARDTETALENKGAPIQSPFGTLYAAHVKQGCKGIRSLDAKTADLASTLLAADACLSSAHRFASMAMLDTFGIENAAEATILIAHKLAQPEAKP